jgi:hypothetical protein
MTIASKYPGFEYSPDQLSKFLCAGDLFTIKLKTDEIIHHEVSEPLLFRKWLLDHSIEDIYADKAGEKQKV